MIDFSERSRTRVWALTIAGTMACIAAALLVDLPNFPELSPAELRRAVIVDVTLPLLLAGPLLYLLLGKIRQLALARDEMAILASTDSLTGVLNRGAFSVLVESFLADASDGGSSTIGSLLVIDADHFKSINDDFGHLVGDDALRTIARVIRDASGKADFVGRIGGEEFAVFLPQADASVALEFAERLRILITQISLPLMAGRGLSVSIGGVVFDRAAEFDRLFKLADDCLYAAKDAGRNQVRLVRQTDALGSM